VVSAQEVSSFAVKAHQQGAKLVDLGKSPLAGEAQLVDITVEQAIASALGTLPGAGVLDDVGNEFVVEAGPTGGFGVKGCVGIDSRFLFCWLAGVVVDRQAFPLTVRMQSIQDVIEDLVQRDAAFVTSFGDAQSRSDVLLELFL